MDAALYRQSIIRSVPEPQAEVRNGGGAPAGDARRARLQHEVESFDACAAWLFAAGLCAVALVAALAQP